MKSLVALIAGRPTKPSDVFEIDPFAWWPHVSSKIAGLGGDVPPTEPATVFHSAYHSFESGDVHFVIRFAGLAATCGTLTIKLNALTPLASEAITVKTMKIALTDVVADDGVVRVKAAAKDGRAFAVFARIDDETDARADSVAIEVTGVKAAFGPHPGMEKARVIFAYDPTEPHLIDAPATLAVPFSQMCTVEQFEEDAYRQWIERMHRPLHHHRKQWEFVYICRMLEYLDMLRPNYRGLGFGCGIEPLPAVFASYGIFVTATDLAMDDPRAREWLASDQLGTNLAALRDGSIVPDDVFDSRVEFRNADMTAIATDLRGYDFTWSSCALEHLGSIEIGLEFIERSLDTLRPGGVAVHTTELNLVSDRKTLDHAQTVLFRRRDIVRLARKLSAQGHSVHPISFDLGSREVDQYVDVPPYTADPHLKLAIGRYVTTSFGLVVRKAA
jgi:2-polyprenyl-3-methyl-5-hydroxy-6-metoxy-1,4-benzoquinol methylase